MHREILADVSNDKTLEATVSYKIWVIGKVFVRAWWLTQARCVCEGIRVSDETPYKTWGPSSTVRQPSTVIFTAYP
jgi:hypothetical protein